MSILDIKISRKNYFSVPSGSPLTVLTDIQFQVEEGQFVSLVGPSGCGKTTLLSLLGGIATPQSGSVEIHGTTLSALRGTQRDAFRADCIGFVFQMFNLVPYLSLINNVTLPCRFSNARRQAALLSSPTLNQEATRLLGQLELSLIHI